MVANLANISHYFWACSKFAFASSLELYLFIGTCLSRIEPVQDVNPFGDLITSSRTVWEFFLRFLGIWNALIILMKSNYSIQNWKMNLFLYMCVVRTQDHVI